MTPLFLGILIGAISCDSVIMNHGLSENGFPGTWMLPFPIAVGLLGLSLFAYLSACYLAVEAGSAELADDFRLRALTCGVVSIAMALMTFLLAGTSATAIRHGLSSKPAAWIVEFCAFAATIVAFRALWFRRFSQARISAAAQVALIIAGWGIAQYPYLIRPGFTIASSAAPSNVARDLDIALACGAIVLIPSLLLLFTIFKRIRGTGQILQQSDYGRG
jgi:cytochrome bd ubiquinol oxidase subunit II